MQKDKKCFLKNIWFWWESNSGLLRGRQVCLPLGHELDSRFSPFSEGFINSGQRESQNRKIEFTRQAPIIDLANTHFWEAMMSSYHLILPFFPDNLQAELQSFSHIVTYSALCIQNFFFNIALSTLTSSLSYQASKLSY